MTTVKPSPPKRRAAGDLLRQRGNHPSVIVWAGQNEPPFDSPWMKQRFTDWTPTLNRRLAQRVADTLSEDRTRIVHRWSTVAEHYWQGWYFGSVGDFLAGDHGDHQRVWRAGAPSPRHVAHHHSGGEAVARQHVTRRSGLEGVAISQLPARAGFWPAKLSRGATIESFIANTRVIRRKASNWRRRAIDANAINRSPLCSSLCSAKPAFNQLGGHRLSTAPQSGLLRLATRLSTGAALHRAAHAQLATGRKR